MKIIYTHLFFVLTFYLQAQDEGFIYGRIITVDDRKYEGPIRWGKEEVIWTDLFNSAKQYNKNLEYLSREDIWNLHERMYDHRNSWGEKWVSRFIGYGRDEEDFTHQFVCQFGEIKSIKPDWRNRAIVEMQNGTVIEVNGDGYNDLGGEVVVLDNELGSVSLDWGRIKVVEFKNTPSKLKEKFSDVLYGKVESTHGTFTGFIAWDNDERLVTDKLDGRTSDGKVSIEFSKIESIEQDWDEADVVLRSGRKINMCCSNDVNNENRGIVVDDEKVGKVSIPWKEFKRVTFNRPSNMKGYEEFRNQKEITGTVVGENGKAISGKIIFDLDEEYTFEILQGKSDKLEYFIPFRNISKITPQGWNGAQLELKNGQKYSLEESQDVAELHQGVLVFVDKSNPTYIRWEQVKEIRFD